MAKIAQLSFPQQFTYITFYSISVSKPFYNSPELRCMTGDREIPGSNPPLCYFIVVFYDGFLVD